MLDHDIPVPKFAVHSFKNGVSCFPTHILSGSLRVLEPLICAIEAPPQFIFIAFLAALSVIAARRVMIEYIPNLLLCIFAVLVGEPGISRKGSTQSLLERFLEPFGLRNNQVFGRNIGVLRSLDSGEGTIEAFPRSEEALILVEEASIIFKKGGKEASVILENLNTIFDGKPLQRNVVKTQKSKKSESSARMHLTAPYATFLGATTPDHINTFFNQVLLTGGFSSRILFVPGQRDKLIPLPSTCKIDRYLEDIHRTLRNFNDTCSNISNNHNGRLRLSRGLRLYWSKIYASINEYLEEK